jgi:hypothetical protein
MKESSPRIRHLLRLARLAAVDKQYVEAYDLQGLQNPLYRRFHKPEYADDFVAGRIRLSTLSACRQLEASRGGDSEEGVSSHCVNHLRTDRLTTPARIGRSLISFDAADDRPITNFTIGGARETWRTRDSFILCFSYQMAEPACARGERPYLVRINNPLELFLHLTRQVRKRYTLRETAVGKGYGFGPITYRSRRTFDFNRPIERGRSVWIKPRVPFEDEAEVRMIWQPEGDKTKDLEKEDYELCDIPGLIDRLD